MTAQQSHKSTPPTSVLRPKLPRLIARIVEQVKADDDTWFDEHPRAYWRIRPYVAGEAWPVGDEGFVSTAVIPIPEPGSSMRARVPIRDYTPDQVQRYMEQGERLYDSMSAVAKGWA
jgi:hypothetical protein